MGWVKLDDRRALHIKLRKAGFAARGLDEAAMCQVSTDGTDGFISDETLAFLCFAHGEKDSERLAKILIECSRWERDDVRGGYSILGYLEYNPTKAEWDNLISKRSAAGKISAAKRALQTIDPTHVETSVSGSTVPSRPVPLNTIAPSDEPKVANRRKQDLEFEALCEVTGINRHELTKAGRGPLNNALGQLKAVGATVDEIHKRAAEWPKQYPSIKLTPSALAKHWASLAPGTNKRDWWE